MMDLSGSTITQGTRMALLLEYLPSDPFPQRRPQVSLVGSKAEVVEGLCSWRHVWSPQVWDEPTSSSSARSGLSMPGQSGGTGMQNLYQGSLVWIWKNVKKVVGVPNSLEDPWRTRYPRSSSERNFPGIALDVRKVQKTQGKRGIVGSGLAVYHPEVRNIVRESQFVNHKSRNVLHTSALVPLLVLVHCLRTGPTLRAGCVLSCVA